MNTAVDLNLYIITTPIKIKKYNENSQYNSNLQALYISELKLVFA